MANEQDGCFAYNIVGLEYKTVAEKYVDFTDKIYSSKNISKTGYYIEAMPKK